jgi:hypothetical protein
MSKVKTMKLQGNDYAKVADRLKKFREECPNGQIKTEPKFLEDNKILFTATVVKDKSTDSSAEATGHALGENKGTKAFEKLETVAIGRALATLGYLMSGEIASTEEMEEFYEYQQEKVQAAVAQLEAAESLDELKQTFMGLGSLMAEKAVIETKDKRKVALSANS